MLSAQTESLLDGLLDLRGLLADAPPRARLVFDDFPKGGLLLSTGVLSMVGVVCTYCMWMLVRCKYRVIALRGKVSKRDIAGPGGGGGGSSFVCSTAGK